MATNHSSLSQNLLLHEMGNLVSVFNMLVENVQPDETGGHDPLSIRLSQYADLCQKVKRAAEDPHTCEATRCYNVMIDIMNYHKLKYNT